MSANADVGSAPGFSDEPSATHGRVDHSLTAHDLAFRARALAQAHALSEVAFRYRAWRVDRDASDHPFPELSTWAATAFLVGYCVRCVEESFALGEPPRRTTESSRTTAPAPTADPTQLAAWCSEAAMFVNQLPNRPNSTLVSHSLVLAALDDVISREIDKRAEHVKEQVPSGQWSQFEDFVGWWTLHGYAIRATEPREL